MSTINMINNIKELFPNYVLFVKVGNFFECYNEEVKVPKKMYLKEDDGEPEEGF